MSYNIHLDIFEGPLDLLLYLVKKNNLDIYDISIAEITAEYLDYLKLMKELNLDIAGEFILMASTLMYIKSQALLPSEPTADEEALELKTELVNKLVEYQKYKNVAQFLAQQEAVNQDVFYRSGPIISEDEYTLEATIFDLIDTYRELLKSLPSEVKEIVYDHIPIEEKIREIVVALTGRKYILLKEILMRAKTKMELVVYFLAFLELIRLKQLIARQARVFGEIRLYPIP